MEFIHAYAVFLIPIIVIVIAQTIKFVRYSLMHGVDWNYLLSPGHMPSAHAAFVTALVVTIGYYDSTSSSAFAVAMGFAVIVIYDAVRIRMHIGDQGKYFNMLVSQLKDIDQSQFPRLKERVGHYTSEVVAGIVVGALLAALLITLLRML